MQLNFRDFDCDVSQYISTLIAHLEYLLDAVEFPRTLSDCGVETSDIPALAQEAAGQWTAQFIPRAVTEKDFLSFYESLAACRPDDDNIQN